MNPSLRDETISDLHKIANILRTRGYSKDEINGIMSQNWINFFRRIWKA